MTRKTRSSASPESEIVSKRPRMEVDRVGIVFDAPFEDFEFREGDDELIESLGLTKLAKIMRSDLYLREWTSECLEFIRSFREVGAGHFLRYRATIRGGEHARDIDFDQKTIAASFGLPHVPAGMQLGGVREAQWKDGFEIFESGECQSAYSSKKGWCLRNLKPEYAYMKRNFDLLKPMIWFSKQSGHIGNGQAHAIYEICTRREARQPDWATGFLKNFVHEILRVRKYSGNFQIRTLIGPVIGRLIHLQLLFDDKENTPPDTEEYIGEQVVGTSGRRRSNEALMEFARPANALPLRILSRPPTTPKSSRFVHSHLPQGSIMPVQSIVSNTQTHGALVPADDLDIPDLDASNSSETGNLTPNTTAGNKSNGTNDRIGTTAHWGMETNHQNSVNDGVNTILISDYQKSRSAQEAKTQRLQGMEYELVRCAMMENVSKREDFLRGVQFLARKVVSVGWLSLKQSHDRHDEHLKWALKALNYTFRLNNKYNSLISSEGLNVYRDVPGDQLWESLVSLSFKGFHHKGSKALAELSWHLIRHADHNNLLKIVADSRALGIILEILRSSYSCLKSKLYAVKSLKSLTKHFDCAEKLLKFPGMTEVLVMLMATDEDVCLHSKAITLLASLIDLSSTTCQLVVKLPSFWDALSDAIFMAGLEFGEVLRLVESISRTSHQCRAILGTLPGVMEVLVHGPNQTLSIEILSNLSGARENRDYFSAFPKLVEKLIHLSAESQHPQCLLISLVQTITLLDTANFSGLSFPNAMAHYGHFGRGAALLQLKHYHSAIEDFGKACKHESAYGLPSKKNEAHLCRAFARTMLMDFEGALDDLKMIHAYSMGFSLDWEKSVVLCLKCDFKRALVESERLVLEGRKADTLFKRDRNYWKHRAYAHFLLGDEVQSRKDAEEALKTRPTALYDPRYWSCPQLSQLPLEYMALVHITTLVLTLLSAGGEPAGRSTIIDTATRMGWSFLDERSNLEKFAPCLLRISNYSSLSEAIANDSLKVPDADIRSLSVAHLRELKCSTTSSLEDVLGVTACGDPTHICSLLVGLDKDPEQENTRLLHHDGISRPKSHPPVETIRQELAVNGGGRGIAIIMNAVGKTLPGKLARTEDRILESEIHDILQDLIAILNRDPDIFPHVHTQALICLTHLLDRQFRKGLSKEEHVRDNKKLLEHCSNCLNRVVQLSKLDTNRMVRDSAQALLAKLSSSVDV